MVERQFKGNLNTTVDMKDGTKITSDFNRDGSGTTVTSEPNEELQLVRILQGTFSRKKKLLIPKAEKPLLIMITTMGINQQNTLTIQDLNYSP